MPKGVRKRGQYRIVVWTPKGARFEEYTTKDLLHHEFIQELRRKGRELLDIADRYEKRGDA